MWGQRNLLDDAEILVKTKSTPPKNTTQSVAHLHTTEQQDNSPTGNQFIHSLDVRYII